jgi:hypothetical protein
MFDSTHVQLLQAMGYELWQRRGVPTAVAPPVVLADDRQPVVAPPATVGAPPATTAAPHCAASPLPGLWGAVLAAAGLDAAGAERAAVRCASTGVAIDYRDDELWIDPRALRGDARAKRTLWKTLRSLRRAEFERRR